MVAFNKYYQDELTFLRDMGREFASAYPALAPMLADRSADPDVERLLEGVAFLTGRIRQKLDDEYPELIHGLAQLVFPEFVRPFPASAIIELLPLPNLLRAAQNVPAGAEFLSVPVDGTPCTFTSCWDLAAVPLTIGDVSIEPLPAGKQQLRIGLVAGPGVSFSALNLSSLRLHLAGEPRVSLGLLMWLHQHVESAAIGLEGARSGVREMALPAGCVRAVGFDDDEALVPPTRNQTPSFRLLQEYFALPAKFAFVDVIGWEALRSVSQGCRSASLLVRFDEPLPADVRPTHDNIRLNCVPCVNLFQASADPIRIQADRGTYKLRASNLPPAQSEVYSIERVQVLKHGDAGRAVVPSFYDFAHTRSGQQGLFYVASRTPSTAGDGSDLTISFHTPADAPEALDEMVASIEILATNRALANVLRPGEINAHTTRSPSFAQFRNLEAPSPALPVPLGSDLLWRLMAHASSGLSGVTRREQLRSLIDACNLNARLDQQAAVAHRRRLDAMQSVTARPVDRLFSGTSIRGLGIDLVLEDAGFSCIGDAFLFCAVLDRLFGSYASINSFCRTTARTLPSNHRFTWPARNGSMTLL